MVGIFKYPQTDFGAIDLEGPAQEPKITPEARDDPHKHIMILYIIAVVVSAVIALIMR